MPNTSYSGSHLRDFAILSSPIYYPFVTERLKATSQPKVAVLLAHSSGLFCFNYFFSRQLSRFHTLFCTVRKSSQSKTIRPVFSSHSDILVITTATLGINKQTLEAASTNQRDPGLCTTCKQQGLKALSDHKLLLNRQLCFPGCGSLQRQPTRMRPGAILSSLSASTTCPKLRQGGQPRLLLRWQKAALCF